MYVKVVWSKGLLVNAFQVIDIGVRMVFRSNVISIAKFG